MTTKQKLEAALKEASVALCELQKDLGKTPEDKVLAKLDEILKAVQAQGGYYHYHVCPPLCTRPHYPAWNPGWVIGGGTAIGVITTDSTYNTNGTTTGLVSDNITLT